MDNRWTEQFKDKMKDYQEVVPDGLWNNISDAVIIQQKRRRTLVLARWVAGAAVAASIVLGIVYMTYVPAVDDAFGLIPDEPSLADSALAGSDVDGLLLADLAPDGSDVDDLLFADSALAGPDVDDPVLDGLLLADSAPDGGVPEGSVLVDPIRGDSLSDYSLPDDPSSDGPASDGPASDDPTSNDPSSDGSFSDGSAPDVPSPEEITGQSNPILAENKEIAAIEPAQGIDGKAAKGRRISLSACVSSGTGNTLSAAGYSGSVPAASVSTFGANPENDIRMFNRTKEVTTGTDYRQPVNVGVMVNCYLSERWSIGTGLEWSWLHSSFREGSQTYYVSRVNDMHYLGIPLKLNCDLWKRNGFKVYAAAGGMVQKCFIGKQVEEYIYNSATGKSEMKELCERQMQWSVCAEAGIEYDFSPFAGVYFEPGATWHFDNGSSVDNIYKSRPLNFSLSVGIRFNFQ